MKKKNLIKVMKDKNRKQFLQLQKIENEKNSIMTKVEKKKKLEKAEQMFSTKSQEIEALQNEKSLLIVKVDLLKKQKNNLKKAKKDRDQQLFLKSEKI